MNYILEHDRWFHEYVLNFTNASTSEFTATSSVFFTGLGTGMSVARAEHNHQDILLTFLGATGAMFLADICRLLKQGVPA